MTVALATPGAVESRSASGRAVREWIEVPQETIAALRKELEVAINGEVRFAIGDRALYATDASNYRQLPYGVVVPRSAEDVIATVRLCHKYRVPVTPRGGGTALAGQTCNTAVILDFSKYMNRILHLDPEKRLATVEPGCVLDHLRDEAEKHGLTFGPDPSTHDHNTLGGMIGNDSCGVHSIMAGRTADNVHSLDILTYDGLQMTVGATSPEEFAAIQRAGGRRAEIYRQLKSFWEKHGHHFNRVYPDIPRRVSGYENLDQLAPEKGLQVARALTGTEATCVIVLRANLNLVPSPPVRVLAIVGFEDIFTAADAVPRILKSAPIGLEAIDHLLTEYMKRKQFRVGELEVLPEGKAWLITEFGGNDLEESMGKAERLVAEMKARGHACSLVTDKAQQKEVWEVREAALAVTAHVPGEGPTWPGWEDSAVHRNDLGDYLRKLKGLFHKHGYEASVYGHFGDGLVHCRINFRLHTEEGLRNWTAFLQEAADLVVRYGGSLSGEHGDGQARAALLERMYGADLMQAQRQFKEIWDPAWRMNPGKVIEPYPITSNLRVGPSYLPKHVQGHFAYPEDKSFTQATQRCVGVGKCRRRHAEGGVMCPSYLGTGEEKHSTRGRARLLFEMLRGDALTKGFDDPTVEEALDLCLGCKGCKHDCPVNVDMAAYKAEFRAHHYKHKLRPRAAYFMGQVQRWARLASYAPGIANLAVRLPGLRNLSKLFAGIAQERHIPSFARQSFSAWMRRHPTNAGGERVLLWPDTFNNYFRPSTAVAAVRLLEHFGFQVDIPRVPLCCGRPLYDWGWLGQAKALWRRTLNALQEDIEQGVTLIGLEPACISSFRDELPALFPADPLALRLSNQSKLLSEFLAGRNLAVALPQEWATPLMVQYHCHHHSVLDTQTQTGLLKQLPLEVEILNTGCCGMAGSFGFEAAKYQVSRAIAENGLLPRLGARSNATLLVDGFSCREQIEQLTGRKTLHLAEFLVSAMDLGGV